MKLKKHLLLALLSFGLSISMTLTQVPVQSSTAIPKSVVACIPESVPNAVTKQAQLIAQTEYQGKAYYFLEIATKNEPTTWDLIVAVDASARCEAVFGNPMGDVVSLANFVPLQVARQLELQILKNAIQLAGGKQKFQAQLLQSAPSQSSYWTTEQLWALKQLGLRPPQNITVISPQAK